MLVWIAAVALAQPPDTPPVATVFWKGDESMLVVAAGPGEVVALDAPAEVALAWGTGGVSYELMGADVYTGVPLPDLRGAQVSGELGVSLCDATKTYCRMARFDVSGSIGDSRKGAATLSLAAPSADDHGEVSHLGGLGEDAEAAVADAFVAAATSDELVLLDFGAVWCPPCNLLAAEVLSDADALGGYVVAAIDVDHPSSFALKDQYAIGSYPTVVIVDAGGAELARTVGYEGRDAFVSWLGRVRAGEEQLPSDPSAVEPHQAAVVAWELVQTGRAAEAEAWLERAGDLPDSVELRLARVGIEATADDVRWLVVEGVEPSSWVWSARGLAEEDDALRTEVIGAVRDAMPGDDAASTVDLLYVLASLEGDDPVLYGAAASLLRSGVMTGDLDQDKGHLTYLAAMLDKAGEPVAADAALAEAAARWPDDPTWPLAQAGLALGRDDAEAALDFTARGLDISWGDNRLRMAERHAKALVALERLEEATTFVEDILAEPGPEGLEVRTHRYRKALAAVLEP